MVFFWYFLVITSGSFHYSFFPPLFSIYFSSLFFIFVTYVTTPPKKPNPNGFEIFLLSGTIAFYYKTLDFEGFIVLSRLYLTDDFFSVGVSVGTKKPKRFDDSLGG
jgi:hypothetical protein